MIVFLNSSLCSQCWKVVEEYDENLIHLQDIRFINEEVGWMVAGSEGSSDTVSVFKTIDGGDNWEMIHQSNKDCCEHLIAFDEEHLIMGVSSKEIYKSNDGGYNWIPIPLPDSLLDEDRYAWDIDFVSKDTGWVSIKDHGLFHTVDGGDSWERQIVGEPPFHELSIRDIDFLDGQEGWVVRKNADPRRLLHTLDGGYTWEEVFTHDKKEDLLIQFLNDTIGWTMSFDDDFALWIHKTINGGDTWTSYEVLPSGEAFGVSNFQFIDENYGWLAGRYSSEKIMMTIDGGETWHAQKTDYIIPGSDSYLEGEIFMINKDKGFVTSLSNKLRRYEGGLPPCYGAITNVGSWSYTKLMPYLEWEMPEELTPICVDGFELRFTYITANSYEFFRIDVGNVNHYQVVEPFEPSKNILIEVVPYSRIHGKRIDVQPESCLNVQGGGTVLVSVDCPAIPLPIDTFICQGEDFVWDGNVFTAPGVYEIPYLDSLNCDSTLTLNLQWFELPAQTIIDTLLQSGDEFEGINYVSDTIFTTLFSSANGCDSIVTYVINIVTDVNNPDEGIIWQLYPNPAMGEVFVVGKYGWEEAILYDLHGRVVRDWIGNNQAGRQQLEVSNLSAGIYLLRLQGKEAQAVLRLVLQ